jgi:hypothetical protein
MSIPARRCPCYHGRRSIFYRQRLTLFSFQYGAKEAISQVWQDEIKSEKHCFSKGREILFTTNTSTNVVAGHVLRRNDHKDKGQALRL